MSEDKENPVIKYKRVVYKSASRHHYMKVRLVVQDESTTLTAVQIKYFILLGLRTLHGEAGAALTFDVLKYDTDTRIAFLRVSSRGLVKLWSTLTLQGRLEHQACAFTVLQVSPFLLALTGNSRELKLN